MAALEPESSELTAAQVADHLHTKGFLEFKPLGIRMLVGQHCLAWMRNKLTGSKSKWSYGTFIALAYLEHFEHDPRRAPPGWCTSTPSPRWSLEDTEDALTAVTARWRQTPRITEDHWSYIRGLEAHVRTLMPKLMEEVQFDEDRYLANESLQNVVAMIVCLWGMEFLWRHYQLGKATLLADDDVGSIRQWIESERQLAKAAQETKGAAQILLRASGWPAEAHRYARAHGGVEASDYSNVVDFTRTHVQARNVRKRADNLDPELSCRALTIVLTDRRLVSQMAFPWLEDCVAIDTEIVRPDLLEEVEFRYAPWMLLYAGSWFVVHDKEVWTHTEPILVIRQWFRRAGDIYRRADVAWDLTQLSDIPVANNT